MFCFLLVQHRQRRFQFIHFQSRSMNLLVGVTSWSNKSHFCHRPLLFKQLFKQFKQLEFQCYKLADNNIA